MLRVRVSANEHTSQFPDCTYKVEQLAAVVAEEEEEAGP